MAAYFEYEVLTEEESNDFGEATLEAEMLKPWKRQ
jgi:hypothetical protein